MIAHGDDLHSDETLQPHAIPRQDQADGPLFVRADESGKVRNDHPLTAHVAAATIDAKTLRGKVFDYLAKMGNYGATDEQMQLNIPMNASTQRPRRVELVELGLVKNSGNMRKTTTGRRAIVWEVVT